MRDVWVIGHVTVDRIETRAGFLRRAGGTSTYFSLALARLGGDVAVLTRLTSASKLRHVGPFNGTRESVESLLRAAPPD